MKNVKNTPCPYVHITDKNIAAISPAQNSSTLYPDSNQPNPNSQNSPSQNQIFPIVSSQNVDDDFNTHVNFAGTALLFFMIIFIIIVGVIYIYIEYRKFFKKNKVDNITENHFIPADQKTVNIFTHTETIKENVKENTKIEIKKIDFDELYPSEETPAFDWAHVQTQKENLIKDENITLEQIEEKYKQNTQKALRVE